MLKSIRRRLLAITQSIRQKLTEHSSAPETADQGLWESRMKYHGQCMVAIEIELTIGIRFGKPNRSQLPMVVFPCRSHHLTELYTRENQCDNLLLHHHHQHHHHLRTCFAFVWLEVIASRSKLLSQHCSVGGMSWTGLHQHRI